MTYLWCALFALVLTALHLYMVGRAWKNGVRIGCIAGILIEQEKLTGAEAIKRAMAIARKHGN